MAKTSEEADGSGLSARAKEFGCPDLLSLRGEAAAHHLDYLDLMHGKLEGSLRPDAVAEFQGRPVLYLVDRTNIPAQQPWTDSDRQRLQQLLANRSEQACLGVIRPGSLEVYPINLDRDALARTAPKIISAAVPGAPTFFQSLAGGTIAIEGQPEEADSVFVEIHNLLKLASDALIGKLEPLEVLSVTGRALFYRFLVDRGIILESEIAEICPEARA